MMIILSMMERLLMLLLRSQLEDSNIQISVIPKLLSFENKSSQKQRTAAAML